ncbi:hypothetical protein C2S51_037764 [Perilla frutescens var. frutescens]|nr:hypothetical protein C2S51_037764 [Perilla frutescens var. frutescens]
MAETAALVNLEEIRSFVSDRLQVVSYKWLSRNFLVSSNVAKRLLEEFVEKYGDGLEVIYSLSGWLKNNPTTYHIRLVPKHMLSDAKQEFDGNCSVQVYSIQACLPKDPATLWNHEFVQAEDLFKQPSTVDNCLRDNRFCGVVNSFVKRTGGATPLGNGSLQLKSTGVSGLSSSYSTPQTAAAPKSIQKNVQNAGSNAGVQSLSIAKPVKTEGHVKPDLAEGAQVAEKEKVPRSLPNNKKTQSGKTSSGTGGALASMWGRAPTKPKPDASLVQADNSRQNSSVSAEDQICARELADYGSSDDDDKDFNIKRTSNGQGSRKRRVVFSYSDEEDEYENAISLGSPDPPKKSILCSKDNSKASTPECNLSFEEKENKPEVKKEKESEANANQHLEEKVVAVDHSKKAESLASEKTLCHAPETDASKKNNAADVVPKRRKVLKTRIDERGREVTVVVWEGEEQDTKSDNNSAKTAENNTASNALNRPPVVRKSPAVGNTAPANHAGKAGNKKAGNKDPKQGNLFSFFKKV